MALVVDSLLVVWIGPEWLHRDDPLSVLTGLVFGLFLAMYLRCKGILFF